MFGRKLVAGSLGLGLLAAGCSAAPAPVAAATPVDVAAPAAGEPDGSALGALLTEYGELLVAAATVGGDALERMLVVTADDRGRFDPACAPVWAHGLLQAVGTGAPLPVRADGARLWLGAIDVPVHAESSRVVHRTDVDCEGRLPHPDRRRPEAEEAAPALAEAASAPTPAAPPAQPAPPTPTAPAPAVTPPEATRTPAGSTTTPRLSVEVYDQELLGWSEVFHQAFEMVVEAQTAFGEVGGGEAISATYGTLRDAVASGYGFWAEVAPPPTRAGAHGSLLAGLGVWADELEVLRTCALNPAGERCQEVRTLRATWQGSFAEVTSVTGIALPSGFVSMPRTGHATAAPDPLAGGFNLGNVRLPSQHEVRRSLEQG
jgi:hypothetical protein